MRRWYAIPVCILLSAAVLPGCGGEDPTSPDPVPAAGCESPDALVAAFCRALADQDVARIDGLLAPDFVLDFGYSVSWPGVQLLARDIFLQALTHFGTTDPQQQPCAVSECHVFSSPEYPDGVWEEQGEYSDLPGSWYRGFITYMEVQAAHCFSYRINGRMGYYARACTSGTDETTRITYTLARMWDRTEGYYYPTSFSEMLIDYLPEGLPHAVLAEGQFHGHTRTTFTLDPSRSSCDGAGLHELPYRFRADEGEWSDWSAASSWEFRFSEPGDHVVTLEVRNTVGWTASAGAHIEVVAAFPETYEELLESFAYTMNEGDLELLQDLLLPEFRFAFMPEDVAAYALETDYLDCDSFLAAMANICAGVPSPLGAPAIENLEFDWAWYDDPQPESEQRLRLRAYRPDTFYLKVYGSAWFLAEVETRTCEDGETRDVWTLQAIVDDTKPLGWDGNISWGGLLATYR